MRAQDLRVAAGTMERAAILGAVRPLPVGSTQNGRYGRLRARGAGGKGAADEAEIAELSRLLDEVRAFARRVPVETRRQLAYQLRKAKQEIT